MTITETDVRRMLTPKENEALTIALRGANPWHDEAVEDEGEWIIGAFVWADSEQGHSYWSRVRERLEAVRREKWRLYYGY